MTSTIPSSQPQRRLRLKICGITRLEDALLCYRLGADALGFIFSSVSERCLSPEQASQITAALPPFCERVGVFVDQTIAEILSTTTQCRLSAIQLHGTESLDFIRELAHYTHLPIIKAYRNMSRLAIEPYLRDHCLPVQAHLIDKCPDLSCQEALELSQYRPIIWAGGLGLDNIPELLRLNPTLPAIDLCSALESSPGCKDPHKLHALFRQLRTSAR